MIEPAPGARVYLDSNAVIYFVEGVEPFVGPIRDYLLACQASGATLVTSELTIAECLFRPYRLRATKLIDLYSQLFDDDIQLVELTGAIARRAAETNGVTGLKLLDGIHYVSALAAACSILLTYDRSFSAIEGLDIVSPGLNRLA